MVKWAVVSPLGLHELSSVCGDLGAGRAERTVPDLPALMQEEGRTAAEEEGTGGVTAWPSEPGEGGMADTVRFCTCGARRTRSASTNRERHQGCSFHTSTGFHGRKPPSMLCCFSLEAKTSC